MNLLKQVEREKNTSFNYIDQKKTQRRNDFELYMKEAKSDKVNINSIYIAIQTLMWIYWQNKIVVKFIWRDRFDRERAMNTNKIAKYDYKEMGISQLDYVTEFNRFMYWVWVQIWDWFDLTTICPKIKNIDPLSCFPDPNWWPTIHSHRFFGFESNMSVDEMKSRGFKNIDKLSWLSETEEQNKQKIDEVRWYGNDGDDVDNKIHTVYFAFTRANNKVYLVATDPTCSHELKTIELIPITEEEKKDPSKILFPIALKYYSYIPWDFFSVSVPDLLRDTQSMLGKIFNALIAGAIRNAYGDDRLVDVEKIVDIVWLQQPTLEWKLIPVKNLAPNEPIQNAIYQIPKDNPWQLPWLVKQYLEETAILNIWIDRNTSWVLSTQNATLWEREMAQRNANIRFLLSTKQGNWFEEFRWSYLWYRSYLANLKKADEKLIYFNNSHYQTTFIFKKDDFVWVQDLKLELVNTAEREQELQAKKADRMALLPQLIAGAKSDDERVMLYREMLEAQGEDEDYIMSLFPLTPSEIRAYEKVEMINEWDINGVIIDDINEDHNVFIRIIQQQAEEGRIKQIALNARYEVRWRSPLMQQNQALDSAQNTSSAQLTNASIQQNKNVPSLQDITA